MGNVGHVGCCPLGKRGEQSKDLEALPSFLKALTRIAARDTRVHKSTSEIRHFLKPRSFYRNDKTVRRVSMGIARANTMLAHRADMQIGKRSITLSSVDICAPSARRINYKCNPKNTC
jgi:hypothetical protein